MDDRTFHYNAAYTASTILFYGYIFQKRGLLALKLANLRTAWGPCDKKAFFN